MTVKKVAATGTIAGALGGSVFGLAAGTAQADDWVPWVPWVPHVDDWVDVNPVAPGQVAKLCPWHSPPGIGLGATRNTVYLTPTWVFN